MTTMHLNYTIQYFSLNICKNNNHTTTNIQQAISLLENVRLEKQRKKEGERNRGREREMNIPFKRTMLPNTEEYSACLKDTQENCDSRFSFQAKNPFQQKH